MKIKVLFLFALLFITINNVFSQEDVTLTVTGQGKTAEEAKLSAFRNAIEQTFGTFVSSNTTVLNDELISDEIISISSGNIKDYEILSELKLPSGEYSTSIKTTISVSKLISFCESKGVEVEYKGSLFAQNILIQEFYEKEELKAIKNMIQVLKKIDNSIFDYEISAKDPVKAKEHDPYSSHSFMYKGKWEVPLTVIAKLNKNYKNLYTYFNNTLVSLSMLPDEVNNYEKVGKEVSVLTLEVGERNDYYKLYSDYNILLKTLKKEGYIEIGGNKIKKEKKLNKYYKDYLKKYYNIDEELSNNILNDSKYHKEYNTENKKIYLRNKKSVNYIYEYLKELNLAFFNFEINSGNVVYSGEDISKEIIDEGDVGSKVNLSKRNLVILDIKLYIGFTPFPKLKYSDFDSFTMKTNNKDYISLVRINNHRLATTKRLWSIYDLGANSNCPHCSDNFYNTEKKQAYGVAAITFYDTRNLSEIKNITKYEIHPK